jgi:hypothetical protein
VPRHLLQCLCDARIEPRSSAGTSRGDIALDLCDQGRALGVEVLRTAACGDAGSSEKARHGVYSFHWLPREPHAAILRPLAMSLGGASIWAILGGGKESGSDVPTTFKSRARAAKRRRM